MWFFFFCKSGYINPREQHTRGILWYECKYLCFSYSQVYGKFAFLFIQVFEFIFISHWYLFHVVNENYSWWVLNNFFSPSGCRSTVAFASLCMFVLWEKWPFSHEGLLWIWNSWNIAISYSTCIYYSCI